MSRVRGVPAIASVAVAGGAGGALAATGLGPLTLVAVASIGALVWLVHQGPFRFAMGAVTLTTLGATSSIDAWVAISTYGRLVALALLLAAALHEPSATTRASGPQRWVLTCLVLTAGVASLSTVWSIERTTTVEQVVILWVVVAIVGLASRRRWRDATVIAGDLRVMVVVLAVVLLVGLAGHATGVIPLPYGGRYQGLLNNPNMAAQVSTLAIFLALAVLRGRRSVAALACIGGAATTIVLSESRTAMLAVVLGVVLVAVLGGARSLVAATGLGVVALVVASFLGAGGPLQAALDRFGEVSGGDTLSGRGLIWQAGLDAIAARPYGWGWGTTERILADVHAQGGMPELARSFHNSVLQVAVEGGLLAPALLVVAYLALVVPMLRQRGSAVAAPLTATIVAGIVTQMAESGVFGTGQAFPYLFWFAAGALLGLDAASREQTIDAPPLLRRRAQVVTR